MADVKMNLVLAIGVTVGLCVAVGRSQADGTSSSQGEFHCDVAKGISCEIHRQWLRGYGDLMSSDISEPYIQQAVAICKKHIGSFIFNGNFGGKEVQITTTQDPLRADIVEWHKGWGSCDAIWNRWKEDLEAKETAKRDEQAKAEAKRDAIDLAFVNETAKALEGK